MRNKNICKLNIIRTILVCAIIGIVLCSCKKEKGIPGTQMPWQQKSKSVMAVDEKKTVFLTFDDGPGELTGEVLDILKKNDVKATFFLIGNQINSDTKKIIKRMKKEGHQIGAHTYSHEPEKIYESAETYYKDVLKTEMVIAKYIGEVPTVYRFPYGSDNGYIKGFRKKIIKRLAKHGLEYCDWNVSGEDSVGKITAKRIIANLRKNYNTYNNPVVLLHDSNSCKETVKALPEIIKMYKEEGYSFDVVKNRYNLLQWKPYK